MAAKEETNRAPLLQADLYLFPKSKSLYDVRLYEKGLHYKLKTDTTGFGEVIDIGDVVGCHVMKGRTVDDYMAYFGIYSYPYRRKLLGQSVRKRQTVTFCVSTHGTFNKNKEIADNWRTKILGQIHTGMTLIPQNKKYLILLNPFSGPGKALQLFREKIAVMLGESEMPYELIITEYANHARNIMKLLTLSEWAGVIIVSGDGLIFEVVNGLMERDDWREAIKLPIGALPGGSSNALCCALNFRAGEPYLENIVLHSTFVLLKQDIMPADLVHVENSQQKLYSFLSTCWGFVADIDIDSEKYRGIGAARFKLTALAKIIKLKQYHGKVSFLPAKPYTTCKQHTFSGKDDTHNFAAAACQTDKTWDEIYGELSNYGKDEVNPKDQSLPHTDEQSEVTKSSSVIDAEMKEQLEDINKQSAQVAAGDQFSSDRLLDVPFTGNTDHPTDELSTQNHNRGYNPTSYSPISEQDSNCGKENCNLLVGLGEKLPDNWVTIEDDFILVVASYQSHLAPDLCPCPKARFDDGMIYLSLMRSGISRTALLNILGSMDVSHQQSSYIEDIPCYAFRIEPATDEGRMTVDGELVNTEAIQGQILPKMMNLIACDECEDI
ncbi:sphingosine kinase 1-like [Tubulanus polymorphus]|uniref:sphingosine kinase 1-like n=1 Tax=Tubulanus polymorphus TaxID=672921 RepID=UPI003DA4A8A3